ncbi:MAG TPA: tetratricopeptide repeat protein [Caldilineaceae bacterium]|nr:tetratricopeptide repeat protein [Caldilineaceae bacterium]
MAHSFATTAQLTCAACHQPFTADLWLIVDTAERPDLLARIRAGTLHDVPCPHCDATNQPDAPLLAYRPDQQPTLIFVPRWGSDEETQRQDAQQLIAQLQANLGAAWQDRWLDEADTLPRLASQAPSTADQHAGATAQVALQLPPTVRSIINELAQLTHLRDMPQRTELCQQALTLVDRNTNPQLWATLQVELGRSLAMNPLGGRTQNLEESIDAYQQALQVMTFNAMPIDWAVTQNNLANAYSDRIRGEQAENLECAIHHYKQALLVRTQEALPVDWAMTQNNLATAYFNRIQGERAENLECAIHLCRQALTVQTREALPVDWAMTQNNLANAYSDRIRGEQAENLECAIHHYKQALLVRTQEALPVDWAMTQNNLATAYFNRIQGEQAENLERAIYHSKQALIA